MPDDAAVRWLLVSKPLRAPFSDGSNVLVRELVAHLPPARALSYFGDPSTPVRPDAADEVVAFASMGHAPSLVAKLSVLRVILDPGRRRQPIHYFFTPNPVTSAVVATLRRLQPRRVLVQTLMSSDRVEDHVALLRPLDMVVVLSDHTAERLRAAGFPAQRLRRIHPGVVPVPDIDPARVPERRRLLYAGDLDASVAVRLVALGRALARPGLREWSLTIAARPKGDDDARHRAEIARELATQIETGRVELCGEIEDMDALMRRCALQVFLADHVRRKVDLPLVVLEGMARGLGLVALDFAPLSEIFARAREHGLEPGATVAADSDPHALVAAIERAAADPELLLTWSRDARALVSTEFSIERMALSYARLYERLEQRNGNG